MTYMIRKETYRNVHRWKLERTNENGSSTWVISHYQTRAAALNHAKLLAGRKEKVILVK